MNEQDGQRLPDDLQDVDARLRAYKPEVSPLELDRIKLRAMTQAERRPASRGPRAPPLRTFDTAISPNGERSVATRRLRMAN